MARRRATKAEGALLVLAIVVGTPIYLANKAIETAGWPVIAVVLGVCVAGWLGLKMVRQAVRAAATQRRRQDLLAKYGDAELVNRIMEKTVWQFQTAEQLRDALGEPVTTDSKVTRVKRTERWMYGQTGANRFSLRITLENGVVTGWDQKG